MEWNGHWLVWVRERWMDERLRERRGWWDVWNRRGRREEVHGSDRVGWEGHSRLCVIVLWTRVWAVGSYGRSGGWLGKVADG